MIIVHNLNSIYFDTLNTAFVIFSGFNDKKKLEGKRVSPRYSDKKHI